MLSQEVIETALNNAPRLPVAILKATELLGKAEVDLILLRKTIESDPVIAGRVLTIANSPFYGLEGEVGNLKEAFMVLGVYTIRNIVMAVGIVGAYPPTMGVNLDFDELWRHAIGTATCTKILAKYSEEEPETALLAGLVLDLGKMFLDMFFPHEYAKTIQLRDAEDCLLSEAEQTVLGIDNNTISALLLERWHIPGKIVNAIKNCEQPSVGDKNALADLVHVANIVCQGLCIGNSGDSQIAPLDSSSMQRLGLNVSHIEKSLSSIESDALSSFSLLE